LDRFPARELVVGDLVLLATGDRIPADCRVVDSVELLVDESSLTGENHPVSKTGEGLVLPPSKSGRPGITDQTNVVFAGTLVTAGRGRALVLAVGPRTEFGRVATELQSVTTRKSPLQNKIDELGKRLAYLSSAAIGVIALMGLLMGRPFLETLTVAVSLAVAAIPEGLPICTTVTLALGVLRMSKRNAIVKKLPVVESLGCATAICSDKTGTLTQNEMTARAVYTLAFRNQKFGLSGVGYATSTGKLVVTSGLNETVVIDSLSEEYTALAALFSTACLCNNATVVSDLDSNLVEGHSGGAMSGQPTELALLVAAEKAQVVDPRPQYHRLQEVPFSSDRKLMEVRARPVSGVQCCEAFEKTIQSGRSAFGLRRATTDGSMYFVKGMPEKILSACVSFTGPDGFPYPLDSDSAGLVMFNARKMASSGLRVLAMAYGTSVDQLTFAGIIAMEDPPREGVAESVWQLRNGGVRVMMVTGDSRETALAIARRCGIIGMECEPKSMNSAQSSDSLNDFDVELSDVELANDDISMSGEDLDSMTPQRLAETVMNVKVFYRVAPRHKLAIVRALQANGDIVAMTGDGMNGCLCEFLTMRIHLSHTIFVLLLSRSQ
jgi:Ca2+-transporting ATPase